MINDFLSIGKITKTHGLRGEVKVISFSEDVSRFKKLKKVYIDGREVAIKGCKLQSDRAVLRLEGVDTIEEAEKYKNKYLYVEREEAVELPEDEYYIGDLIGCTVYDTNGIELGSVYDVLQTGSNDVYWVKKDKEELLIPTLKEIVVNVDVASDKIIIKPVNEWS